MAQRHLDRLSAVDAAFLHQEDATAHMQIGGLVIIEGPPARFDDFLAHIAGRLHLVPRYRQKLAVPPYQTGRPLWVDDPRFSLDYHVRRTALPEPGGEAELLRLAARVFSQRLDRSRPLWEMWLVEGLEGGRVALITKTHHALVDGIAGVELLTVLFDLQRTPPTPVPVSDGWHAQPEPGALGLLAVGARDAIRRATEVVEGAVEAMTQPVGLVERVVQAAQGLGEVLWAGLNPAPETPLNVPIGPHRRYTVLRERLADFKTVKNSFGGTVNDAVLSVVAGALARWLRTRGVRTDGLELRGLVPVSIRAEQTGPAGNALTVLLGPLPVYVDDPVERLRIVSEAMDGIKESKQAVGARVLTAMESFAPPTILAQASRLNFSTRMYNLLVTNVPGPQFPVFVLGREVLEAFPIAFLAPNQALAIAVLSYNGNINFGLIGDWDALPDIEVVAQGIRDELGALLEQAQRRQAVAGETDTAVEHNGHRRSGTRGTRRVVATPGAGAMVPPRRRGPAPAASDPPPRTAPRGRGRGSAPRKARGRGSGSG